ncbi:MAG TPA: hypothetical protein ENI76_10425 [Ignavibacteria bacterium]|nr:hypothetical protein [Ignavibacteria bacterium]
MMNVALVGFSTRARNIYRIIDSLNNVNVKSILRLHTESTSSKILDNTIVTNNFKEAVDSVDAVIIACHPSAHLNIVTKCISIGVPIMIENPVALSIVDYERIFKMASMSGIPILVNHSNLFSSEFEALISLTSSWYPIEIEYDVCNPGRICDHSQLLDLGPESIIMASLVLKNFPEKICIRKIPSRTGELFNIDMYSGSSSAKLSIGNSFSAKKRHFEVRCGKRFAIYNNIVKDKLIVDGYKMKFIPEDPIKRAILSLYKCVTSGEVDYKFSTVMNIKSINNIFETFN